MVEHSSADCMQVMIKVCNLCLDSNVALVVKLQGSRIVTETQACWQPLPVSNLSRSIPMTLLFTFASHHIVCMFTFTLQLHLMHCFLCYEVGDVDLV